MKIKDKIYGEHEFPDFFKEIINCKEIQRLKKIHQNGADYLIDPNRNASRYEHSAGVMILAKILGGSIESQLAGLIHDISHTVFSHTVDLVMSNSAKGYHESIKNKYLEDSEIVNILKKLGFDFKKIINEENFSIIETKSPDLCADRLDYFLRDMYNVKRLSLDEINMILDDLTFDKVIKCKSVKVGKLIIRKYIELNEKVFFNVKFEQGNLILSKIIRNLLDDSIIKDEDLLKTDDDVITIIKNSKFKDALNKINNKLEITEDSSDRKIIRKLRYVDPLIGNKRTSKLDIDSQNMISDYLSGNLVNAS
tara:strand:+ start:2562 stop:3488 length:927 start_codon:yes stop_codon:yes gene_type:complete